MDELYDPRDEWSSYDPPDYGLTPEQLRRNLEKAEAIAWDMARRQYLAGETVEAVCARHGLARSTFHQRARDEGWRRRDQPQVFDDAFDDGEDEPEADEALPSYADMADQALRRVNGAIRAGRAAEASSWMRLHDRLRVQAASNPPPEPPSPPQPSPPSSPAAPKPEAKIPDTVDAIDESMRKIDSIARRARLATTREEIEALIAEAEALPDLRDAPDSGVQTESNENSDLDSLDSVFSADADPDEIAELQRLKARRTELGLGVSDLDDRLRTLGQAP